MDKGVDKANLSAILAFFNEIAAELGLEDCHSVKELRILVPILINYMDSGVLSFFDNPSFTFSDAVKRIAEELDDPFHSLLDAEAAEREDEFEMAKIHLALLYTFRLVQKDVFSSVCEKLRPEHHNSIAEMIGNLDDRQRWAQVPWPRVLQSQPTGIGMVLFEDNSKLEEGDSNKENIIGGANSGNDTMTNNSMVISTSPTIYQFPTVTPYNTGPSSNSHMFASSRLRSPSRYRRYKDTSPSSTTIFTDRGRSRTIDFSKRSSPIARVMDSPRGQEVERIHQLEKEVKSLREIRDIFGQDKDRAEEICQQKEQENRDLKKRIETLEGRLALVLPDAERVPRLMDQQLEMEAEIATLTNSLKDAQAIASSARAHNGAIQFELQKLEIKQGELDRLQAEYEKADRRAKDELQMHEQTRRKLLEVESQYSKELASAKTANRELANRLEQLESEFNSRLELKDRELAGQLEMVSQCKERSEDIVERAEKKAADLRGELETTKKELVECKQTLTELCGIAEQQKAVVAEQQMERQKLEHNHRMTQDELNTLQEMFQQRELEMSANLDGLQRQFDQAKRMNSALTRGHLCESDQLRQRIQTLERELQFAVAKYQRELHELNGRLRAVATERDEYHQQMLEREATVADLRRQLDELRRQVDELRRELEMAQRKLEEKGRQQATLENMGSRTRLDPTPSKSIIFAPSRRTSVFPRSSATSSASSIPEVNHDERLKELRERNSRNPPHLRSNYLPEAAHLKSKQPNLDVFPAKESS